MKCIDCDKIISCNKNGEVCSEYKHTPRIVTRLEEKDGDYFKFEKMEENDKNKERSK